MFSKKNLRDIPIEETPHFSGSRRLLVSEKDTSSKYFKAFTYGYLPPNEKWLMHKHENIIEICLVVKGSGLIKDLNGKIQPFKVGDRFVFPSDTEHEIENTSKNSAEFYFIRIQDK